MERRILSVLAHPDDESFGMGGTLAKYAAEGARVHLICATRGEAGEVDPEYLEGYQSISDLRVAELNCAAKALGLDAADPLNAASQRQIEKGRLMPIVPEMRAIWDSMRSSYQSALNGEMTSTAAAQRMQADAVRNIERMKE